MNIELRSEYVFSLLSVPITNTFLTALVVTAALILAAGAYALFLHDRENVVTKGARVLVFELLRFIDAVTRDRALSKSVFPLVATFFLFIVTANLFALLPGFLGSFYVDMPDGHVPLFRSPNSDLTSTIALAAVSVFAIQLFSVKMLGPARYVRRFLNFTNPIQFIVGLFEMLSEAIKVLSFSFRLFGNMFAGEALLLVIAFLLPYIIPLPFMLLEIFVGVVQAFIFAMLTLTFIRTSVTRVPEVALSVPSK